MAKIRDGNDENVADSKNFPTSTTSRSVKKTRGKNDTKITKRGIGLALVYAVWVVVAFYGTQFILGVALSWLPEVSILNTINSEVLVLLQTILVWGLTALVAIYIPPLVTGKKLLSISPLKYLGFNQLLPHWRDIGLALAAYVACFASAIGLVVLVAIIFPDFDLAQAQSLPFDKTGSYGGVTLAWIYLTLCVFTPIGEEVMFRGYLFGRLRKYLPAAFTVILSAVVFASLHVLGFSDDGSIQWQWNVVVGLLPLSIGLGLLREYTGSVWAGIILHSIQNTLSFLVLYVFPITSL